MVKYPDTAPLPFVGKIVWGYNEHVPTARWYVGTGDGVSYSVLTVKL